MYNLKAMDLLSCFQKALLLLGTDCSGEYVTEQWFEASVLSWRRPPNRAQSSVLDISSRKGPACCERISTSSFG